MTQSSRFAMNAKRLFESNRHKQFKPKMKFINLVGPRSQ